MIEDMTVRSFDTAAEMQAAYSRASKEVRKVTSPKLKPHTAPPRLIHVRPDARHHVDAYRAWVRMQSPELSPVDYLRAMCVLHGLTLEDIRRDIRGKYMVNIRKDMVCAVSDRFPRLSSPQLGKIFHRDHASILNALKRRDVVAKVESKLTEFDVLEIRRRAAAGETHGEIAKTFGVNDSSIGCIVRRETWKCV